MKHFLQFYVGESYPFGNKIQKLFTQELFCLKFHDDLIQLSYKEEI
jgi:hypothetical protein